MPSRAAMVHKTRRWPNTSGAYWQHHERGMRQTHAENAIPDGVGHPRRINVRVVPQRQG